MNWKFYNNAVLPDGDPREFDAKDCDVNSIFRTFNRAWMIRYTTDFDCSSKTTWWYCIKDSPFDITKLNAKRRYVINSGRKNFEIKKINPNEYIDEIATINFEADKSYSIQNNLSQSDIQNKVKDMNSSENCDIFGAFSVEEGILCGYLWVEAVGKCLKMVEQKCIPAYEKKQINAAMVDGICSEYRTLLETGSYLCDGERNIYHQTAFQDYLEKYFHFRKAYSTLNVKYRKWLWVVVHILYPFREQIKQLGEKTSIAIFRKVYAVLLMEEYSR